MLGGLADFIIPALVSGGSGIITGLGNVVLKVCVKLFDLFVAGREDEAKKLQAIVAKADWHLVAGGITSFKSVLNDCFEYGGYPRRPLPKASQDQARQWVQAVKEVVDMEKNI